MLQPKVQQISDHAFGSLKHVAHYKASHHPVGVPVIGLQKATSWNDGRIRLGDKTGSLLRSIEAALPPQGGPEPIPKKQVSCTCEKQGLQNDVPYRTIHIYT